MSKKESSPKKDDQAPDLSALDFGPAWARKDQSKKPRRPEQGKPSHGGESGEKRAPQGGRRQSPQGRDGRRDSRDNRGDGRRDERRDDRRGDHKKGNDRRDFKKDGRDRDRKPIAPPAEGVKARIMPIEEGMDAMAKQITATGRTHSVFELAWVVLGGLERFHCVFESEEQPLYRSNSDHSVWIYQKECLAHLWSSNLVSKYYEEEIAEIEAPKGNFQSVARCGFSGQLIGPPNHHAYQQTLLDIHREKFSNMALDRYKSKIVMEHTEEAVQEWVDSMRKHKRWRPKTEKPVEEPEDKSPEPAEATEAAEVKTPEADVPETEVAEADAQTETPATPILEEPVIEETVVILNNHREVEQHFLSHGFEKEFESGKITSALANIPPHMISPGLMSLLKTIVAEEKRYPGNLASILCRQMSGRHLAVYKWKKRLHCGPARPKRVSDDMVMADRPSALFHWVISHPGGKIDTMWKDCMPADVDDDAKHLWYHDLHWLINEGLVLLLSDGTLHAAKELEKKPAQKQAKKKSKKKATKKATKKTAEVKEEVKKEADDKPAEEPKAAAPKEEAPKAEEADVVSPQEAPALDPDPDPVTLEES